MNYVEEKVIECKKCGGSKRFIRNSSKPNYLLHILLVFCTFGFWILALPFIFILGVRIGGEPFSCTVCGSKYQGRIEKIFNMVLGGIILLFAFFFVIAIVVAIIERIST